MKSQKVVFRVDRYSEGGSNMKYFIYQGNDHDCGFAALKMFLSTLAKDKSYLFIPKPSKREYYSLDDLVELSKAYGVTLEGFGCEKEYFECLKTPSLTLIDDNHVVMIKKRKKKSLIIYDPGRGVVRMKKDEFLRRWRCVVLETENPESVFKIEKYRQHIISPKLNLISSIVSLISAGLLIAAFYLLNKTENFLFSLIFLVLFVCTQIAEKCVLYRLVYTFDKEYIPKYFENKKNCTKEKYIQFNEFKKQFFTCNRQTLASVLLAFTVTFLLCFNDFRNVFVLLALILFKLLELIIFSRSSEETKSRISELENQAFRDSGSVKDLALEASFKADKHMFGEGIKDIFYIFLAFVFAVAMMFATQNIGCNFVIFHFVMYYAGFVSYNQLLNNLSFRKENAKMERRFFDSCNL